jgi:hypothetical protein
LQLRTATLQLRTGILQLRTGTLQLRTAILQLRTGSLHQRIRTNRQGATGRQAEKLFEVLAIFAPWRLVTLFLLEVTGEY